MTSAIKPRQVRFDWARTPLHWVPDDPQTTHTINVLHLLLPAGERWFVHVYKQALPLITEDVLREDVRGFMGQEAVHSRAHSTVLDHLAAQGIDSTPYTKQVEWMFDRLLGDNPLRLRRIPRWLQRRWLMRRLAIIAAVEHFTAVLGWWVINSPALDRAGADATMLDLLRWHGAEEVEHRSVAFDVYRHVGGTYAGQILAMIVTAPVLIGLWFSGVRFFMKADRMAGAPSLRHFRRAGRRGLLPSTGTLLTAVPRYLRPTYHPSQEGETAHALAYLSTSPAAAAYRTAS
ncbi:MAG: metal-dependent hydrolase [Actinomycetota bacterium]